MSQTDVFREGEREESVVLAKQSRGLTERGNGVGGSRVGVDQDLAVLWLVESREELDECGFAATVPTYNHHDAPRWDSGIDLVERGCCFLGAWILEGDVPLEGAC